MGVTVVTPHRPKRGKVKVTRVRPSPRVAEVTEVSPFDPTGRAHPRVGRVGSWTSDDLTPEDVPWGASENPLSRGRSTRRIDPFSGHVAPHIMHDKYYRD